MGASFSQRPGKCLKSRRAKSEEKFGPKRNFKHNMCRFFAPCHCFINENIANNGQENVNATQYFPSSDWISKDVSDMEKSLNEIHHSNSMVKDADHEIDCEKVVIDNFVNTNSINANEECINELSYEAANRTRLIIDGDKDSIFEVNLQKGNRGLGFRIMELDGFIFIKQLFPYELAAQSGLLHEGDIILSANGTALRDLSIFEAIIILRRLKTPVTLIICRRLQQFLNKKSITSSHVVADCSYECCQSSTPREYEFTLQKVNRSLGFTLRKDDENECRHVVRALVKEPALSDGRIRPGDEIVCVNDTELDNMTHQEAVKFIRNCGDEVKLKLRRDNLSTSLTSSTSSQVETNNKTLRKEALDMLNYLAVKKLKIETTDDQLNINAISSSDYLSDLETLEDGGSSGVFKQENNLFDSRENLSNLQYSASHQVHDNSMQITNDLVKLNDEPVSLPPLDVTLDGISFHHNDLVYHSINMPNFNSKSSSNEHFSQKRNSPMQCIENDTGLLKWKGIILDGKERTVMEHNYNFKEETITVHLQRIWNSRLGFSLHSENESTVISTIHADSVAANDGRLRINDKIIEVNGKNFEHTETSEIIEYLRTVRGKVTIVVQRNKF